MERAKVFLNICTKFNKMAKEKEKATARILYVEQGKTAKEIAMLLEVSEKTISAWVNADDENWKAMRKAKITSPLKRIENLKSIINDMVDRRIELSNRLKIAESEKNLEEMANIKEEIAGLDDAVSKWNKTLENMDKENRMSLTVYIRVMDDIFDALRLWNEPFYYKLLAFQEQHIRQISNKLG